MIQRTLSLKIQALSQQFPALAIVGPRQSGKTTLVRHIFNQLPYVSLEDFDRRSYAIKDPRGFLSDFPEGVILDEAQNAPQLFSYLQTVIDETQSVGKYILTGSQNFLLHEAISQSLSGRIALLTLLPLSIEELKQAGYPIQDAYETMYNGFYPRLIQQSIDATDWYPNYISTYIERDLRKLKNIFDLNRFQTFIQLCAGRVGQLLNYASLANDCGITLNTAKAWLNLLEASYIIFLLKPYHENFNKRLIKSPKLYFYDIGLAISLLGVENKKQVFHHPLRGAFFENLVIADLLKCRLHRGKKPNLYFWRDSLGHEVDLIYQTAVKKIPIEIKSAKTVATDFFDTLHYWNTLSKIHEGYLIYDGPFRQKNKDIQLINWQNTAEITANS